jgi:ABC-type transporter MlaC component
MKKVLLGLFVTLFSFAGYTQGSEFDKMMRKMYQEEFIDIMNENMNLSESDNALFQPIFKEFLGELGLIMDKKLVDQGRFADYFDTMTDEQVKSLLTAIFDNSKAYQKMLGKYTKKVAKEIGPQSAFRFYLIVEKVKSTFDYPTIQNIPLVKN